MDGDDRRRFCRRCALHVQDMTDATPVETEAMRTRAETERVCIRRPIEPAELTVAPRVAGALMWAALGLGAAACAPHDPTGADLRVEPPYVAEAEISARPHITDAEVFREELVRIIGGVPGGIVGGVVCGGSSGATMGAMAIRTTLTPPIDTLSSHRLITPTRDESKAKPRTRKAKRRATRKTRRAEARARRRAAKLQRRDEKRARRLTRREARQARVTARRLRRQARVALRRLARQERRLARQARRRARLASR